jgi:hypothetical protein
LYLPERRPTLLVMHDDSVEADSVPLELYQALIGEVLPTRRVQDCYHAINAALSTFRPSDSDERMMRAGLVAMRDELISQRPSLAPERLH